MQSKKCEMPEFVSPTPKICEKKYSNTLIFSVLVFMLFFYNRSESQYFEAGFSGGFSKYRGDLTPKGGDVELKPAFSFILKHHFNKRFAVRFNLMFCGVSGSDENASDEAIRRRNLSFRSKISEFSLMAEYNPFSFMPTPDKKFFRPYLLGGVGFFGFNPEAKYAGTWVKLRPIGTEGQSTVANPKLKRYQTVQASIPVGIGLRYSVSHKASVGFEATYHFTTTDYLDDVSTVYPDPDVLAEARGALAVALSDRTAEYTGVSLPQTGMPRGNSNNNDSFMTFRLFFTFNFFDAFPFTEKKEATPRKKTKKDAGRWF